MVADPEVGDTRRQLRVATRELVVDGLARPVEGIVLIQTARYPAIGYGAMGITMAYGSSSEPDGADAIRASDKRAGVRRGNLPSAPVPEENEQKNHTWTELPNPRLKSVDKDPGRNAGLRTGPEMPPIGVSDLSRLPFWQK